ncbi:hypothetical protein BJ546DRAFT_401194 [Cryomyces antarcticus]
MGGRVNPAARDGLNSTMYISKFVPEPLTMQCKQALQSTQVHTGLGHKKSTATCAQGKLTREQLLTFPPNHFAHGSLHNSPPSQQHKPSESSPQSLGIAGHACPLWHKAAVAEVYDDLMESLSSVYGGTHVLSTLFCGGGPRPDARISLLLPDGLRILSSYRPVPLLHPTSQSALHRNPRRRNTQSCLRLYFVSKRYTTPFSYI